MKSSVQCLIVRVGFASLVAMASMVLSARGADATNVTYYRVNGEVRAVSPEPASVVVPRGMHAHTKTDGTTIVHGDENWGDPVAHEGVEWPWNKSAVAGQVVAQPGPVVKTAQVVRYVTRTICENGVCRLVTVPVVTPAGAAETAPPPASPGVAVAQVTSFGPVFPRVASTRTWLADRPKVFNGPVASRVRFFLGRW